jgi:hypothetical protein
MNLLEAYNEVYNTEYNLSEDLTSLLLQYCIEDVEEAKTFAEDLLSTNLVQDFLFELSEALDVDISEYLTEGVGSMAVRGVINALSSAGRSKAGLAAGTALGRKPESLVRGAAASASIRSARAARPAASTELPGKYAAMQFKKRIDTAVSRPALPAARSPVAPKPTTAPKRTPADAGMPFRATGPGGDARTQRLAAQAAPGSGVRPTASRMTGGADALNVARRAMAGAAAAGVAASAAAPAVKDAEKKSKPESSINKYNTMDSDGKIRNRLAVGPKIVGPKKVGTVAQAFDTAFAGARKAGKSDFEFQGKKYTTKMKEDRADYFDDILEYLVSEGFVNTNAEALNMMACLDEAAVTKLFYKLQSKGKGGSSTARAQLTSDADLETQKNLKMKKQKQKQMRDREDDDDPRDHGSMSAAERNPSMR